MFQLTFVRDQEWLSKGKVIHSVPLTKTLSYASRQEAEEQQYWMENSVNWQKWFIATLFRISPPVSINITEVQSA